VNVITAPNNHSVDVSPTAIITTVQVDGVSPVVNLTNLGQLTLTNAGAIDQLLAVHYTAAAETIDIDAPAGTITATSGGPPVNFVNFQALQVYGREGDDTFNVTPQAPLGPPLVFPIFVDGGDPIGSTPGDKINIINTAGNMVSFEQGPENDEGSFVISGGNERVSFDHIEAIGPIVNSPCVLILGTTGDDDITVIARDSSYTDSRGPGRHSRLYSVD
jgi:hypothetical protein